MIKFLAVLCEPAFVGLVQLLYRRYAIRFQGKRVYWKAFITEMGRDLCRINPGRKITVRSSISTHFSPSSRHFQKRFSPASCMRTLFGVTRRTRSRKFGFVGYIRRHGFILPIIRDWFFMPHGGRTAVDDVSFRLTSYDIFAFRAGDEEERKK
jgi:hypothetical protein